MYLIHIILFWHFYLKVYIVRAPNHYCLTDAHFQNDKKLKFAGDLTEYPTLVKHIRDDKYAPTISDAGLEALKTAGVIKDVDEAKKAGYGGRVAHDMHVSWKVSVKCELDRVGFPGKDDDSDDCFDEIDDDAVMGA